MNVVVITMKDEIIKKYNLVDFTKYDSLFDMDARIKGEELYKKNPFQNLLYKNNVVSGKIEDAEVSIEFEGTNIVKTSCTCCNYNCKHVYALLIESTLKGNYPILKKVSKDLYKDYYNTFSKVEDFIKEVYHLASKEDQKELDKYISLYKDTRLPRFKKILDTDTTQLGHLSIISEMIEQKEAITKVYQEISKMKEMLKEEERAKKEEQKELRDAAKWAFLIGLFWPNRKK